MQLKKIFEPITINKTEFINRMVASAMVTNLIFGVNFCKALSDK